MLFYTANGAGHGSRLNNTNERTELGSKNQEIASPIIGLCFATARVKAALNLGGLEHSIYTVLQLIAQTGHLNTS